MMGHRDLWMLESVLNEKEGETTEEAVGVKGTAGYNVYDWRVAAGDFQPNLGQYRHARTGASGLAGKTRDDYVQIERFPSDCGSDSLRNSSPDLRR